MSQESQRGRTKASNAMEAGGYLDAAENNVSDILTDLMHYCQVENINFRERLDVAQGDYEAEGGK